MVNISKTFSSLLIRQVNGECCFGKTSLAESTSISEVSALPMDLHFLEKLDDSTDGLSVVKDAALAMSHGCWIFHPSSFICLLHIYILCVVTISQIIPLYYERTTFLWLGFASVRGPVLAPKKRH
jgi:hypothetical protein